MVVIISFFLLSQAFIIYCCAMLGKYHSEIDEPEIADYEYAVQDEYVREWNLRHENRK